MSCRRWAIRRTGDQSEWMFWSRDGFYVESGSIPWIFEEREDAEEERGRFGSDDRANSEVVEVELRVVEAETGIRPDLPSEQRDVPLMFKRIGAQRAAPSREEGA